MIISRWGWAGTQGQQHPHARSSDRPPSFQKEEIDGHQTGRQMERFGLARNAFGALHFLLSVGGPLVVLQVGGWAAGWQCQEHLGDADSSALSGGHPDAQYHRIRPPWIPRTDMPPYEHRIVLTVGT